MEETYPDFFRAYFLRLRIKEQVVQFNRLVQLQAQAIHSSTKTNRSHTKHQPQYQQYPHQSHLQDNPSIQAQHPNPASATPLYPQINPSYQYPPNHTVLTPSQHSITEMDTPIDGFVPSRGLPPHELATENLTNQNYNKPYAPPMPNISQNMIQSSQQSNYFNPTTPPQLSHQLQQLPMPYQQSSANPHHSFPHSIHYNIPTRNGSFVAPSNPPPASSFPNTQPNIPTPQNFNQRVGLEKSQQSYPSFQPSQPPMNYFTPQSPQMSHPAPPRVANAPPLTGPYAQLTPPYPQTGNR